MEIEAFRDSWGRLWAVCDGADGRAEAFGPRGLARRLTREEEEALLRGPTLTETDDGGWEWLTRVR